MRSNSLLPYFRERKGKSLILTFCSTIKYGPLSYGAVFAACKVFEEFKLKALSSELYNSKINFISMHPKNLSTNNARLPQAGS